MDSINLHNNQTSCSTFLQLVDNGTSIGQCFDQPYWSWCILHCLNKDQHRLVKTLANRSFIVNWLEKSETTYFDMNSQPTTTQSYMTMSTLLFFSSLRTFCEPRFLIRLISTKTRKTVLIWDKRMKTISKKEPTGKLCMHAMKNKWTMDTYHYNQQHWRNKSPNHSMSCTQPAATEHMQRKCQFNRINWQQVYKI